MCRVYEWKPSTNRVSKDDGDRDHRGAVIKIVSMTLFRSFWGLRGLIGSSEGEGGHKEQLISVTRLLAKAFGWMSSIDLLYMGTLDARILRRNNKVQRRSLTSLQSAFSRVTVLEGDMLAVKQNVAKGAKRTIHLLLT